MFCLLSGPGDETALTGLRAGAVGYLLKAISVEAIPEAVRKAGRRGGGLRAALDEADRAPAGVPEAGVGLRPVRSVLISCEWEILDLLCSGASTDRIGDTLVLSAEAVRSHVKNLLR